MSAPRKGERLRARCGRLDEQGAAVVALPDALVHVPGALADEEISAEIEHVSPHRTGGRHVAWARLEEIAQASPDRVAPVCPGYGRCGGCPLQHLAYEAQLAWKRGLVEEAFAARATLARTAVDACVASPRPLGYRNQAKYVVGGRSGRIVLGAFAPRSHEIVDLAGCRLVEPPLDDVARTLREVLDAAGVAPFDERRRTGTLRYVVLRASAAGEVLATLVTARRDLPGGEALAARLRALRPEVVGVVQNVNAAAGNFLFGSEELALDGATALADRVGSIAVTLGARAFFQINRHVAALAYEAIRRDVAALPDGCGLLVDAFAGVGGIALTVAPHAREVVAIEENDAATAGGAATAAANGASNVRFVTADAAAGLAALHDVDAVVLNPPRGGCAPEVLAQVARLAPRLVLYLSCNPVTLARDLDALAPAGLRATRVTPFDMLPHTAHVETLARLTR